MNDFKRYSIPSPIIIVFIGLAGYLFYYFTIASLSDAILLSTLLAVIWYTIETNRMQKAAVKQSDLSKETLSVDLTLKFDDRFNNKSMLLKRKFVSQELMTSATISLEKVANTIISRPPVKDRLEDILDFFETIGQLVRRGTLDEVLIWHTFYHWFYHYYFLTEKFINYKREKSASSYPDIKWLHQKMLLLEKERNPEAKERPSQEELQIFLLEEAQLEIHD